MTGQKTRVLVLFGGRSPEHDVSIITGLQALDALDPARYDAQPLYIAPNGAWLIGEALRDRSFYIPNGEAMRACTQVTLHIGPSETPCLRTMPQGVFGKTRLIPFDIAFLAFHGLVGEDGRIQGLFETANVPYTGMRQLASAVLMDKAATKRMIAATDVPQLPFLEIKRPLEGLMLTAAELEALMGDVAFPCCIKPAHLGSSIGVARVDNFQEVADVLPGIFRFDDTALLEPFVENMVEYNVAVRRINGLIQTSAIEKPKRSTELLDFRTKYCAGGTKDGSPKMGGSKTPGAKPSEGMLSLTREINPQIAPEMEAHIRAWAATVFETTGGTGVPRLDFLCNEVTGDVWFNEANPCPGSFGFFLWEAAEKPVLFTDLLENLLTEAQDCHARAQIPADPTPEDARLFPRR